VLGILQTYNEVTLLKFSVGSTSQVLRDRQLMLLKFIEAFKARVGKKIFHKE